MLNKLFNNKKKLNVAVVGATGAVGQEMIKCLAIRKFPIDQLRLFASKRSKGKTIETALGPIAVEELTENSFDEQNIDIALFSAGGDTSKEFAPHAARNKTVVIDNSSAFRMDPEVPLIVPEVNPDAVDGHKNIIANPNCSTIQMVVALKPLHDFSKIRRVVVSTYQAVSGAGLRAMTELRDQTLAVLNEQEVICEKFPYRIAFNAIPQIDVFQENGYTKEEMKMVLETRKIMGDDSIGLTATTVRIPVFRGHSESVNVETENKISAEKAKDLLKKAKGIKVVDNLKTLKYPLPVDCEGKEDTFVGRIREDESIPNGLNLWIVSDNLLKGAALNAVQIAELLVI